MLIGQMAYMGPILVNTISFIIITRVKINLGRNVILKSVKKFVELDMRLKKSKYLAYDEYTIADIATFHG